MDGRSPIVPVLAPTLVGDLGILLFKWASGRRQSPLIDARRISYIIHPGSEWWFRMPIFADLLKPSVRRPCCINQYWDPSISLDCLRRSHVCFDKGYFETQRQTVHTLGDKLFDGVSQVALIALIRKNRPELVTQRKPFLCGCSCLCGNTVMPDLTAFCYRFVSSPTKEK
jgi:hypothetical protein